MKKRVVVTGIGIVSSLGIGKDKFWKNLIEGKSGIGEVSEFHSLNYAAQKGGIISDFKSAEKNSGNSNMGRASLFAIEAVKEALSNANMSTEWVKKKNVGFICGTTNGESHILEEIDRIWLQNGEEEVWAKTIIKYPVNSVAINVSSYFNGIKFANVIPTACAAGNYSISYAYDLVRTGKMDAVIAGGSDPLTRYAFAGFGRLFAMAPEKCQPFDKNRKGMMIGEGAGILILENLESVMDRKIEPYAEILGYGLSCDANNMTAPRLEGIIKVMEKAIKNSNVKIKDIDYISAHGTGTPANDSTECKAIREVMGKHVEKVAISSIKSMLGHTMGAASAIEAAACCLALKNNIMPPTINYETADPECNIDCVPNKARKKELKVVLNNSFAFGGNNACLVLGKFN